jgi:hypothetical protein
MVDRTSICPRCQKDLTAVISWDFCALWGYYEMRSYECPDHGAVFVSPQITEPTKPRSQILADEQLNAG